MPRQNRRRREDPDSADGTIGLGTARTESGPDGDWVVRPVPGPAATKTYRCPGCDQEIEPGTPHLVAWPASSAGADDRRHWHTPCWAARTRRTPRTARSRNAPRY